MLRRTFLKLLSYFIAPKLPQLPKDGIVVPLGSDVFAVTVFAIAGVEAQECLRTLHSVNEQYKIPEPDGVSIWADDRLIALLAGGQHRFDAAPKRLLVSGNCCVWRWVVRDGAASVDWWLSPAVAAPIGICEMEDGQGRLRHLVV